MTSPKVRETMMERVQSSSDQQYAGVLIVEDDADDRAFLETCIDEQPELALAACARTCSEGLAALDAGGIEAVVLDLNLPDGSGLRVLEHAVALRIPVLILTVLGDEATAAEATTRGAAGYLLKDTDARVIGDAIVRMLAGEAPLNARVARFLLDRLVSREQGPDTTAESPLTPAERRVLELVACGHTQSECAAELHRSAHTVATHIKNIYSKLAVHSRAEAVSHAFAHGLLDPSTLLNGTTDPKGEGEGE